MISKLILVSLFSLSLSSFAADKDKLDWTKCAKETAEYKCTGTDKEIYECLEKHDSDLSKTCQVVHEAGDKLFAPKK